MRRVIPIFIVNIFISGLIFAQKDNNFQATYFGIISDGISNNTTSIQSAIDYIAAKGGGKLNFYVGRYLTGGLELKSNVTIELHEGAILVASSNVNDYSLFDGNRSLLFGTNLSNVKIIGKGVVEGNPDSYFELLNKLEGNNLLTATYLDPVPALLTFSNCKDVEISGIIFQKAFKDGLDFNNCSGVSLDSLTIRYNVKNSGHGVSFRNTIGINLANLFVDPKGKALVKDKNSKIVAIKHAITPDGKSIL